MAAESCFSPVWHVSLVSGGKPNQVFEYDWILTSYKLAIVVQKL